MKNMSKWKPSTFEREARNVFKDAEKDVKAFLHKIKDMRDASRAALSVADAKKFNDYLYEMAVKKNRQGAVGMVLELLLPIEFVAPLNEKCNDCYVMSALKIGKVARAELKAQLGKEYSEICECKTALDLIVKGFPLPIPRAGGFHLKRFEDMNDAEIQSVKRCIDSDSVKPVKVKKKVVFGKVAKLKGDSIFYEKRGKENVQVVKLKEIKSSKVSGEVDLEDIITLAIESGRLPYGI